MTATTRYLYHVIRDPLISYSLIKLEWPSTALYIPSSQISPNPVESLWYYGDGESIPWSDDAEQIARKALLFRRDAGSARDGIGAFYFFQDRNGFLCWTPFNGGNPSYENRQVTIDDPDVDVQILSDALRVISLGTVTGGIG